MQRRSRLQVPYKVDVSKSAHCTGKAYLDQCSMVPYVLSDMSKTKRGRMEGLKRDRVGGEESDNHDNVEVRTRNQLLREARA